MGNSMFEDKIIILVVNMLIWSIGGKVKWEMLFSEPDLDFRREEQDVGGRERLQGRQLIYNS